VADADPARTLEGRRRTTWRNHLGNQEVEPLAISTPRSLDELVALVKDAERQGTTVRAVGSGHSWSDAALGTGFLLLPHRLSGLLDLEEDELRPRDRRPRHLVHVKSGTRVKTLNAELDRRGLALSNMGGYDGQTIAGVISTSTHGSGTEFGPLSDFVRSLDLVGPGGVVYRVEPAHGPTDRAQWERRHREPEFRLVQDDHWFAAVKVGIGSLGLLYAVMLEVEPSYLLTERRAGSTWERERERIAAELPRRRHYELLLSPHARRDGSHMCMVTTRTVAREKRPWWSSRSRRKLLAETLSSVPGIGSVLSGAVRLAPKLTPFMTDLLLKGLADDEYTNKSFKVLNIGPANNLPAYSSEIGVPVDEAGTHIAAVDRVLEIADRHRRLGSVYHTGAIALRFVKASDAYLSMMEGRPTMMIELIELRGTYGGLELLAAYEDALYDLGGRPHWGQINTLTGSHELLQSLYPRYADWLDVHSRLNSSGVFDSPFTKRVGISPPR
jgi:L-gulono-1,4-lactone dehydrogenase